MYLIPLVFWNLGFWTRLVRFRKTTPKSTPKGWWYTFLGIPLNRSRIDRNGATCQIAAYLLVIVAPIVGLFVQDRGWQVGLLCLLAAPFLWAALGIVNLMLRRRGKGRLKRWKPEELDSVQKAASHLDDIFEGTLFDDALITITRVSEDGIAGNIQDTIRIKDGFLAASMPQVALVHEFAHAWDYLNGGAFSRDLPAFRGNEPGPTAYGSGEGLGTWATHPPAEEWAESVAAYLCPEYISYLQTPGTKEYEQEQKWVASLNSRPEYQDSPLSRPGLGPLHRAYVAQQIEKHKR